MQRRATSARTKAAGGAPQKAVERGILDELLGYQLRRAQTALFAHFQERLQSLNVTPGQLGLLMMISANPGISQVALARAVGIERASLGEFIDRFERDGLVDRRETPNDRRSYALHLTRSGQRFLESAIPAVRAHEEDFASHLSVAERRQLLKLLTKLAG